MTDTVKMIINVPCYICKEDIEAGEVAVFEEGKFMHEKCYEE